MVSLTYLHFDKEQIYYYPRWTSRKGGTEIDGSLTEELE